MNVVSARGISRVYPRPSGDVIACHQVDLDVAEGDFVVLHGRSGAGKTTVLNLLGGLDRPTTGTVLLAGQDLAALSDTAASVLRRDLLGFVFQSFGLLPTLSAAENVEVPLRLKGTDPVERDARVAAALDMVGLSRHARQRPGELSGGQQQRVGVARAIVGKPRVLFADEPTAQLDSATAAGIIDLISDLVRTEGIAAVVSTHHAAMAERATRTWEVHDGRIVEWPRRRARHAAPDDGGTGGPAPSG